MKYNEYTFEGYTFYSTCSACPEQYDVYQECRIEEGFMLGYVRLRGGRLSAGRVTLNRHTIEDLDRLLDMSLDDDYMAAIVLDVYRTPRLKTNFEILDAALSAVRRVKDECFASRDKQVKRNLM